jgi:hypothetical protein
MITQGRYAIDDLRGAGLPVGESARAAIASYRENVQGSATSFV